MLNNDGIAAFGPDDGELELIKRMLEDDNEPAETGDDMARSTSHEEKDEQGGEPDDEGRPPKAGSLAMELFAWAQEIVICLIIVVFTFIFVVRVVGVDGSSMNPTLYDRDKMILLSNFIYEPEAGDIVVLTKESFSEIPLVKRVIATEGQTIDIDFDTGDVWVDDVLLSEPYINETTHRSGDVEFPATVPEGCIFVMGDNRNASSDSRFTEIGMIDERCVLGKVLLVAFPLSRIGTVE